MKNMNRKHLIVNIAALVCAVAAGVLLAVFSDEIYSSLSKVQFLKPQESAPSEDIKGEPDISYGAYKAGTYTATVYGFESDIKVTVEVSDTEIVSIKADATGESNVGRDAIKLVKESILNGQSAQVDAVSGATYSTEAFIEAVKSALSEASVG